MKLVKRVIIIVLVVFFLTVAGKNLGVEIPVTYYGLDKPIKIAFWELVLFCGAVGFIVAAFLDFLTQLKWSAERRRMVKTDKEHQTVVDGLKQTIANLETEKRRLEKEVASLPKPAAAPQLSPAKPEPKDPPKPVTDSKAITKEQEATKPGA